MVALIGVLLVTLFIGAIGVMSLYIKLHTN